MVCRYLVKSSPRRRGSSGKKERKESREIPVEGPAGWIMPQLRASSYGTLGPLGKTSTIIPVSII